MQRIAVYTTIYPGVEVYLPDWYRSVQAQTDHNFQLWIGLDGIEVGAVETVIGTQLDAVWVPSEPGNTPARIRQRSLEQIVEDFDAVILWTVTMFCTQRGSRRHGRRCRPPNSPHALFN